MSSVNEKKATRVVANLQKINTVRVAREKKQQLKG